jgi:hypothetical protein
MISVNVQKITGARYHEYDAGEYHKAFDSVEISTESGMDNIALFLPAGTGAAVAAAIRDAIAPPVTPPLEAAE